MSSAEEVARVLAVVEAIGLAVGALIEDAGIAEYVDGFGIVLDNQALAALANRDALADEAETFLNNL